MSFLPIGQVRSLNAVASALGCSVSDLEDHAAVDDQRRFYERLRIPKKGKRRGQFRTVYKANQRLALIQKNIAVWLGQNVAFPECVQGFVHKRSIVTNARIHLGQRLLLHADIKDFFDSITTAQVEEAFRTLGCPKPVANALSRVCTLNGQLPQGSSASPIIANLVCRHLDDDFQVMAGANHDKYSRYADDITISGEQVPDCADIVRVLQKHGFALREGSCRTQRRGKSQYVTGLTVGDVTCPRVPRVMKRRLRLELYYARRYSVSDHLDHVGSNDTPEFEVRRLHGWMSFIFSVEGKAQRRLYEQWEAVSKELLGEDESPREDDDRSEGYDDADTSSDAPDE